MKRLLLPALMLLGCAPNVFHTEVKGSATISGDPSPLPGLLDTFPGVSNFGNLDFNQNQDFKNQGVKKDQVKSVKLDKVTLRIASPNSQDFRFLQSLQFFAKTGDQQVLIAEKQGIDQLNLPAPNPTLELDVQDAELQPYVTADTMSIIVSGKGRYPAQDTQLDATVGIRVEVKVF